MATHEPIVDYRPKQCPGCRRVREPREFHRNRTSRDGLQWYCVDCDATLRGSKPHPRHEDLPGENWRPVAGFEGWYEVSDLGRVKRVAGSPNCRQDQTLRPSKSRFGYPVVALHRYNLSHSRYVHALVAEAFIGPRPTGKVINHIDCDPANNHHSNLEYVTQAENIAHAARLKRMAHGPTWSARLKVTTHRGMFAPNAKLTDGDVREIRRRKAEGESYSSLSRRFNVAVGTIQNIIERRTWTHL